MDDKNKTLVRYSYDELARRRVTNRFIFDDWEHLNRLHKKLPENAKILDAGCGTGIPIDGYLIEKGHNVVGIDISKEQLRLAKSKLPSGEFKEMDMEHLDFQKNTFDAVVSFYSIFHIPKEKHLDVLKNFYEVLKPNGVMMITMGSRMEEKVDNEYEDIKLFWSQYGQTKNLKILTEAGFSLIYSDIHYAGGTEHLIIFAEKSKSDHQKAQDTEKSKKNKNTHKDVYQS